MPALWKHRHSTLVGPMLDGSVVLAAPRPANRRRRDDPRMQVLTLFTNRLQGDSPAVIDSVSPATPGLAPGVVFRYGMLTRNHGGWGFGRGWPPSSAPILPLRGAVVRAFTVRYHVGGAHYQATFAEGIAIRVTPRCPSCAERDELAGRLR